MLAQVKSQSGVYDLSEAKDLKKKPPIEILTHFSAFPAKQIANDAKKTKDFNKELWLTSSRIPTSISALDGTDIQGF